MRDGDAGNCSGGIIDEMTIDAPVEFVPGGSGCPTVMESLLNTSSPKFKPRIGLSATPNSVIDGRATGICIRYGDSDVYGAVRKTKGLNRVVPMWKVGNDGTQNDNWSNWMEL